MPAALRLPLPATGYPAGIGWHERLVVLLRFSRDDGKEKRLLPFRRFAGAIEPSIGRLAWTTQSGNDHGSGIRGERISEGHGKILPDKKKYAMQKINLAKCPQCRQSTRMSNNQNIQLTRKHTHNGVQFGYSKKHGWMLHYSCAIGCGWIPCVPNHIK
jgi:hypothetical protein